MFWLALVFIATDRPALVLLGIAAVLAVLLLGVLVCMARVLG